MGAPPENHFLLFLILILILVLSTLRLLILRVFLRLVFLLVHKLLRLPKTNKRAQLRPWPDLVFQPGGFADPR